MDQLIEKIKSKSAVVGVLGLGYVGLPLAVEKAKVGFRVIGIDQDKARVAQVNAGQNYIRDVKDSELKELVAAQKIMASTDFSLLTEIDVIVIAVPTPLTKNLTPDLQFVEAATRVAAKYLRKGQLICLESTTYPGTTEQFMLPILEESKLKVETDFFLAYSPERVDPGNKHYNTKNTPKVVGGVGPHSLNAAISFYSQTIEKIAPVSSAQAAELVKVFENTFRAINIALVNELALLCDRMEINVWEVLEAAHTKPFGIMPFFPGPGVGGHCIPLDPHYLEWKAREMNFSTHFITLAGEINRKMPEFVVEKSVRILNRLGLALSKSKIVVLGVAYKKDHDDYRESPVLEILKLYLKEGAQVSYHDPFVESVNDHGIKMTSVALDEALLSDADLVVITTGHSLVDYSWVVAKSKKVLDTRNATKVVSGVKENVTLL